MDIGNCPLADIGNCPLVANKNCPVADTNLPMRVWPPLLGVGVSGQGFDSFPVQGLGQAHGVAAGLAQMCMMQ